MAGGIDKEALLMMCECRARVRREEAMQAGSARSVKWEVLRWPASPPHLLAGFAGARL